MSSAIASRSESSKPANRTLRASAGFRAIFKTSFLEVADTADSSKSGRGSGVKPPLSLGQ
jgi:hypothetical protein